MKKLLSIIVLGLLLSGNANAGKQDIKKLEYCADDKSNSFDIKRFISIQDENWGFKRMKLKKDKSNFDELLAEFIKQNDGAAQQRDNGALKFLKKSLTEKLQAEYYEEAFIECEKMREKSKIMFGEKYKKPILFKKAPTGIY